MMVFNRATKFQSRARIALVGPSGSGKTYTALTLARGIGSRVAVIDTERGSASKYSDEFEFDVLTPESFAPQTYIDAIHAAEAAGYDVLVIDSLSHAWMGKDGALEQVDRAAKRSQSGNSFAAWRDVTPQHNALVDAMLQCRCHLIATMRAKTEYVLETVKGKQVPRKVGMAPVQRDGVEYEFDIVGDLTLDHDLLITKTRCRALDGTTIAKPGIELAKTILSWLTDGTTPPTPTNKPSTTPPAESQQAKPQRGEVNDAIKDIRAALTKSHGTSWLREHEDHLRKGAPTGECLQLSHYQQLQRHAQKPGSCGICAAHQPPPPNGTPAPVSDPTAPDPLDFETAVPNELAQRKSLNTALHGKHSHDLLHSHAIAWGFSSLSELSSALLKRLAEHLDDQTARATCDTCNPPTDALVTFESLAVQAEADIEDEMFARVRAERAALDGWSKARLDQELRKYPVDAHQAACAACGIPYSARWTASTAPLMIAEVVAWLRVYAQQGVAA